MTDNLDPVFKEMDQQDILRVTRHGLSEELVERIRVLCAAFRRAQPEMRDEMRTAVTAKATAVLLRFVTAMAVLAAQKKDKEALDLGLVAFDLSNIMRIDFRDAGIPVARLAFSATECGVRPVDRASVVIPDISPRLLKMLSYEQPAIVLIRDRAGNTAFSDPRPLRTASDRRRRKR
jgi:hypothetical protein